VNYEAAFEMDSLLNGEARLMNAIWSNKLTESTAFYVKIIGPSINSESCLVTLSHIPVFGNFLN